MPRRCQSSSTLAAGDDVAHASECEEEDAEQDDRDEKPRMIPKKQKGGRDVKDLPTVGKMDAEDLVDAKLEVETAVHEKGEAMEKTHNELMELIEKVAEYKEDFEKLKQFDIDRELSTFKQCMEKMAYALKGVRSARLKGLKTDKEPIVGLLKEADECVTAMNGIQVACKMYINMRSDKLEKSKGQLVYQEGSMAKSFISMGAGKGRVSLSSMLLYHAKKEKGKRPENWLVAADVTAEFSQFKPALFTKEKTPIDDILASMKV